MYKLYNIMAVYHYYKKYLFNMDYAIYEQRLKQSL